MTEIVVNKCYGVFGLSDKAIKRYAELKEFSIFTYKENIRINKSNIYEYIENSDSVTFPVYVTKYLGEVFEDNIPSEYYFFDMDIPRDDLCLVQTVKELGTEANGDHASLKIVDIPDDVDWILEEYDGIEWISEMHRTW